MRRALAITAVLAVAGALVVATTGAGSDSGSPEYKVELDNAFGLIQGADLKIGGVRAGKLTTMDIDRKTKHAIVGFKITKNGFGDLRKDVTCETRPQSLIGEYYIDCQPGSAQEKFPVGGTIPISRTSSTVAPDLVNNILRLPYAQRLQIILAELGTGVGARGTDLNAAIRRFSPALRETQRVLDILAKQNRTLTNLAHDADLALAETARRKKDVARWVTKTANTAEASAERQQEIADTFKRLPAFLAELGPTMHELGKVAGEQAPALTDLDVSAKRLNHFFTQLKPFTKATNVSLSSLGKAADVGTDAVRAAGPTVDALDEFAAKTPSLGNNLAIVLHDLDDRGRAVEPQDKRANNGQGYSGLEAILQYVFDQSVAINVFDQNGYLLKVNAFANECSPYQNAESVKAEGKEYYLRCSSQLGPNQPGVLQPDPTASATKATKARKRTRARQGESALQQIAGKLDGTQRSNGPAIDLQRTLRELFGGTTTSLPKIGRDLQSAPGTTDQLLDYLLAP